MPLIDAEYKPGSLPPNTLVRLVGMVQDIRDPELYGRVYTAKDTLEGAILAAPHHYCASSITTGP